MFDGAEPISYHAVRDVVHEELGMWPEEIFAEFDPNPIGSAVSVTELHSICKVNWISSVEYRASPPSQAPHGRVSRREGTKARH